MPGACRHCCGSQHLQALEVFHICLLLGFQGRYILEGSEKLSYFTSRLGDEIAHMKGTRGGFAPRVERPNRIATNCAATCRWDQTQN